MFVSSKMVWEVHIQSPKWLNSYPTTLHCAWHRSRSIGTMHQALRARGSLAQGVAVANMLLALVKIEKKLTITIWLTIRSPLITDFVLCLHGRTFVANMFSSLEKRTTCNGSPAIPSVRNPCSCWFFTHMVVSKPVQPVYSSHPKETGNWSRCSLTYFGGECVWNHSRMVRFRMRFFFRTSRFIQITNFNPVIYIYISNHPYIYIYIYI